MARKTSTSRAAASDAKRSLTATKRAVLSALSKCMHEVAFKKNSKLPYGVMQSYVDENRKLYHWVTRDSLNSTYTRYKRGLVVDHSVAQIEVSNGSSRSLGTMSSLSECFNFSSTRAVCERKKGGRPIGTTDENKHKRLEKIVEMKNDITLEYQRLKDKGGKKLNKGELKRIVEKHKIKRNLEEVDVPLNTIRRMVSRGKNCCYDSTSWWSHPPSCIYR